MAMKMAVVSMEMTPGEFLPAGVLGTRDFLDPETSVDGQQDHRQETGKPNNKGNFKKGARKSFSPPEKPKAGPKPDTVCYYCKEKGHWKRNCSKYLADLKSGLIKKKKGIFDIHVIDVYLTGSRSMPGYLILFANCHSPPHRRGSAADSSACDVPSPPPAVDHRSPDTAHRRRALMEPNEPINTKLYQLGNGGSLIFEHDLNALSDFLGRPHPEFHGIQVNDQPGGELQWVITADLRGKMEPPTSERILFSFCESNWLDGLARGLQEALARLCGQNVVRILASRFAHLVRRDAMGVPMELQPHPELRHHAEYLDFMLYQTQKDLDAPAHANLAPTLTPSCSEAIKPLARDRKTLASSVSRRTLLLCAFAPR
ncbi:hypothetical protein QYE76_045388 [Lolium multiflorum]|uniref:CCHC-type domain-containing protein n=1 Tax=Lolium multiflorum TaxID=4521 RepID=A0AAD8WXL5_LOLMU|nr:hypothetical protein QYE76_045388 [Lolium multiflorum]